MSVLLSLLYPVVVYSALKPGIALSLSWWQWLSDGDYHDDHDNDDDEIVHLREMDRWPGLLSDSLDISQYQNVYSLMLHIFINDVFIYICHIEAIFFTMKPSLHLTRNDPLIPLERRYSAALREIGPWYLGITIIMVLSTMMMMKMLMMIALLVEKVYYQKFWLRLWKCRK